MEGHILENGQKVKAIELILNDEQGFTALKKNFQWMFIYNPVYVNYLGVVYHRLMEKDRFYIITEDFSEIGPESIFEGNSGLD